MNRSDSPHTIMLVGADRAARTFLADNLTADGYEVIEAGSVASARRLLEQSFADLAVVDRDLPDADGLELLRWVRESPAVAARVDVDLPVILVAGDVSP